MGYEKDIGLNGGNIGYKKKQPTEPRGPSRGRGRHGPGSSRGRPANAAAAAAAAAPPPVPPESAKLAERTSASDTETKKSLNRVTRKPNAI